MAIAFDSSSYGSDEITAITWSHTCTGSNLILIVWVDHEGTTGNPSTVTYNGVSLTQIPTISPFSPGGNRKLYGYYLIGPTTGAHNIIVNNNFPGGDDAQCFGASYSGVSQTGFPDSGTTFNSVSTATATLPFTTVADNAWVTGFSATGNTASAGAATTIRKTGTGPGVDAFNLLDSNGVKTPAGSYSLIVTQTAAFANMMGVSIAPATGGVAGSTVIHDFQLLNIGN